MLTRENIISTLERNTERLQEFGVKHISLFGSYATGAASERSDIDFLVEFTPGRGLFDDFVGLQHFLETLFSRPVDIVKPHLAREELREHIFGGSVHEANI